MPIVIERRFESSALLLESLTTDLSECLGDALRGGNTASLLVSGGRTPAALFDRLSRLPLDWPQVRIGLVDERCVPADSDDSNEKLVRTRLLRDQATGAHFVPMMNAAAPAERAATAWQALQALRRPFDVVMLGMGDDGHTASWFPGSAALPAALDPHAAPGCLDVLPLAAPHERLTINFSAALQTHQLIILINGERKWQVYQQALQDGPEEDFPVRAILRQKQVPVELYWSP
ncbi:MAG: 6-phosphogluconolactonase [Steroidobacteraceae bacterium]